MHGKACVASDAWQCMRRQYGVSGTSTGALWDLWGAPGTLLKARASKIAQSVPLVVQEGPPRQTHNGIPRRPKIVPQGWLTKWHPTATQNGVPRRAKIDWKHSWANSSEQKKKRWFYNGFVVILLNGAAPSDGPAGQIGGTICTAFCSTNFFCSTIFARPNIFARPILLDQLFLLDRFCSTKHFCSTIVKKPRKFANSPHKNDQSCSHFAPRSSTHAALLEQTWELTL